jgi:class 3 adenylate cyclase
VRIGIHQAEASRSGLDYVGSGVNVAARIGATAAAGEILASADTLRAAAARYAEEDRRQVDLKGIAEPVEVVRIGWQ